MKILKGKQIILGVTGSIAAYKSVELASSLTKSGALVDVILTNSAAKLVTPITFSSVTGKRAYLDEDLWKTDDHVLHIKLGENNQAFLIAPATANTIAKLAHGQADNLVTLTALASRSGVIVAPAMDGGMYQNPATQENLSKINDRGLEIWGPAKGHLASGLKGFGRMLEPTELLGNLRVWLGKQGLLSGKKVVVTAGGTREAIDPVRVLSNRSSGKQGYALAQAALDQGAEVTLISGLTCLSSPVGARLINVQSAGEMADTVLQEVQNANVLIMAAAVADYRPNNKSKNKLKKDQGELSQLDLVTTPDILKEVAIQKKENQSGPELSIGFAAETEELLKNAQKKLHEKELDLIIANDISKSDIGIGADQNQVVLVWQDGKSREIPQMDKEPLSDILIEEIAKLM
jgi:phosphopantothenoylcysteine decarboxylase/phosphopantothenate--cysteine ligase